MPLPRKCWDFSLEMAHFGANSVVYFNRKYLAVLLPGPRQLLYIAGGLRGSLTGRVLEKACEPSAENCGTFSLEMYHFVANSVVF